SKPLVTAIGQMSVQLVIGTEGPLAQERSYEPVKGSYCRGEKELEKLKLHAVEVGGQALVPVQVWDGLGVPCRLGGFVWDDAEGELILKRLADTAWVDWSSVVQVTGAWDLGFEAPATEHATVVTWFGQRVIIDGPRNPDHLSDLSRIFGAD